MELPEWLKKRRAAAEQRLKHTPASLKYGLTIRLDTRGVTLKERGHSEQAVTIRHEGAEVHNLFDRLDDPRVKEHLLSTRPAEPTAFSDFQESSFDLGLLVIVPPGGRATIDLTRTVTSEQLREHTLVICEPGSHLTLIDKYQGAGVTRAGAVEIICEEQATARYAQVQYLAGGSDLGSYRARLAKDARVDWFIASLGADLTRADVDTWLEGDGSRSRSYGVFLGDDKQQFDIAAATFHRGSHSESDMYTRGVLDGKAKGVYRGTIDIAAQAFGCNGYQKEETILLSGDAVADAIPNLEIRNNDVKCSHGATIGRLDEEQLFYLTSRGVPREDAIRMVVEGFFEPLAHRLAWPELFNLIKPLVHERVS